MKTLQSHQQPVEKVVAKEGFVDGHRVYPGTVNNPETGTQRIKASRGTEQQTPVVYYNIQSYSVCVCVPEGEDNEAGDNEDCSK